MARMALSKERSEESPVNHGGSISKLKSSDSCAQLTDFFGQPTALEEERIQNSIETRLINSIDKQPKMFHMRDLLPFISQGARNVVQDDFTICFESPRTDSWNWNAYLYVLWLFGVFLRYCIFFPIRLTIFAAGNFWFFMFFLALRLRYPRECKSRTLWERRAIRFLASVWNMAWTGVIRYHGSLPKHEPNQIYVANHTTMVDYAILQQVAPFAAIGQKHKGWVGWMQDNVLKSIGGVWFERGEAKDRSRTSQIIRKYISQVDDKHNRLLVFPEGTCVNNKYCVQFKRGAFDVGAAICPIAIKYNSNFINAYWNSREKSFQRHIFDLMTSWALVCDIYFLEPQTMLPHEDSIQFAARVKEMICDAANITGVDWNGYLKYFRPSKRFVEERQKFFAESLLMRRDEMQMHRHAAHFSNHMASSGASPPYSSAVRHERTNSVNSIGGSSIHSSLSSLSLNELAHATSAAAAAAHISAQLSPNKENHMGPNATTPPHILEAIVSANGYAHTPPILLSNGQLKTRLSPPSSSTSNGTGVVGTVVAGPSAGVIPPGVLIDSTNERRMRGGSSPHMRPSDKFCTNLCTVDETAETTKHDPNLSNGTGSSLPSTPSQKLAADPRLTISSGNSPTNGAVHLRTPHFSLPANMKLPSPHGILNGAASSSSLNGGVYRTAHFADSRFGFVADDNSNTPSTARIHDPNDPNDLPMLRNQGLFPHSRSCGSLNEHGLKQRRVRVNMPPDE